MKNPLAILDVNLQFIKTGITLHVIAHMESGWNCLPPSLSPGAVGVTVLQTVCTQGSDIRPNGEGYVAPRVVQYFYADLCT
ncbi:hypothetical protein C8C99_4375 [Acidovorax sp. 107]|nr:hypothetical protein C8C99_4375 [Acidovorax sp. 107]